MALIDRQDAIDVLKRNYPSSCFEDLCKAVDLAIKALSAQPEPRWIPCSERLLEQAERHESERAFNEYLKRKEDEHVNKNS